MTSETRNIRFEGLDGLRGLAAVIVMLAHYSSVFFNIYPGHEKLTPDALKINLSEPALLVFFLISGFVIPMSLERAGGWKDFLVMRFSRIVPAYWTCLIITFLVTTLIPVGGRGLPLWKALINLALLQHVLGVDDVDVVYWTLYVELYFYVWVLLSFFFKSGNALEWIMAGLAGLSIVEGFTHVIENLPVLSYRLTGIFMIKHSAYFLAGITLYSAIKKTRARHYLFFLLFMGAVAVHSESPARMFVNLAPPLLVWAALRSGQMCAWIPGLQFLSRISYPLYLVHANVGYTIMLVVLKYGQGIYAGMLAAGLCAIVLASLVSYQVEYPAMRWLRQLWRQRVVDIRPAA